MKRKATRFIILDEVNHLIVRKNADYSNIGNVREFKTSKAANQWASERLGNWVILEQVQWHNDTAPWLWYTINLG